MNKRIALIVLMLTICMAFSSCGSKAALTIDNGTYTVYVIDVCDCDIDKVEYGEIYKVYAESNFTNITPSESKTVVIGGQNITGTYSRTYNNVDCYYPVYNYHVGKSMENFDVDEKGRVTAYMALNTNVDSMIFYHESKCAEIARTFVEETSGYEGIDWSIYKETIKQSSDGSYYNITYERYVDELKTTEWINVSVKVTGRIMSFTSRMYDRISEGVTKASFDMEKVETSVYAKLDQVYKNFRDRKYTLSEPVLTVVADGTPCLIYEVEAQVTSVIKLKTYTETMKIMVCPSK